MNENNLRPQNTRTKEEQREIAKKGGIASGIARKKKKDTAELVKIMLGSALTDKDRERLGKKYSELHGEDMTINALLVSGMVKSALNGNVKAFQEIQKLSASRTPRKRYNLNRGVGGESPHQSD